MPVRIVLLLLFVSFSSLTLAQTLPTQIRGPKSSDGALQKQFGPLTANDTLWRVAEQVKPVRSVTTYQVMYALFLKNPDAFIDGNFNHLKPGATLLIPDIRDIRQVDPSTAQQKAEMDNQLWSQRLAREDTARRQAKAQASKPNPVQQQTAAELNALKDQYHSSMQLIEGIAQENDKLRGSLGDVQQELAGLKSQLAADSELQQQLNQVLQQQQDILAEQQRQREAEQAAAAIAEQNSGWQSMLQNPLILGMAAFFPALLMLLLVLFWVKRRSKKAEAAIASAVQEPKVAADYKSPLPPLDNSQDFDDSLFDLDDGLLGDVFSKTPPTANSTQKTVDDELPDFSDDILLDDFSGTDPLHTDELDLPVDPLDAFERPATTQANEPETANSETEFIFDADNILSDTDLSALLSGDDAEEVIELSELDDTEVTWQQPDAAEALFDEQTNDELLASFEPQTESVQTSVTRENKELDDFAEQLLAEIELEETAELATGQQALNAELDTILAQAEEQSATSNIPEEDVSLAEDTSLDLASADDNSVAVVSEATLSVENPSQVLDSYPELDWSEHGEQATDELAAEAHFSPVEPAVQGWLAQSEQDLDADSTVSDEDDEPQPDELDAAQFDLLLNQLESFKSTELPLSDDTEFVKLELPEPTDDEPVLTDSDFVEIDNLLSALEQTEEDPERFNQLNVDVGLDDFADIIGVHTKTDVDLEDAGFAGKLDLIRAYIEMDEPESAALLIDEVLTSEAPEHVKEEAKALRPE